MLAYFITGSNVLTLRTNDITSGSALKLNLQNMTTLVNTTASITNYSYNTYESLLQFTASISGAATSEEYRATITSGSLQVWAGSVQVYASESSNTSYTNQNTQYISHESANEYIIF